MKKLIILIIALTFFGSSVAYAESGFFGAKPEGTPSVLNYGWEGMTLGIGLGVSAGYLSSIKSDKGDDILLGAAYGAIAGTATGLIFGFNDAKKGEKGYGAIILRDMHLGGNLGLAVGAAYGTIAWIKKDKAEYFGESVAWGYIAGTIVGLGIGMYEGPILTGEKSPKTDESKHLIHGLTLLADSHDQPCPGYQVVYRF